MLLTLRRKKEPDEIDEIRRSLGLCAMAYDTARATIAPGLREVDVFCAMSAAINKHAGTAVPFPGDFACGERCIRGGGPPTDRIMQPGDLYILDLFPAPALYFGDTSRAYAVTEPTLFSDKLSDRFRRGGNGRGRSASGVPVRESIGR